jgi:putative ATP-binding cassette transporter
MFRINFKKSLLLLIFAIPNTLLNIGLLYIINSFLTGNIHKDSNYLIFVFFYFLIYSYLINNLYQGRLIKHIFSSIYDSEIKILKILHDTPLPEFEKYGSNRFYNTLEDLRIFIFLPSLLINALNSVLTILICLSYLFWISPGATSVLSILIFLIVGSFIFLNKRWYKKHKVVRELNDEYYNYIDDSLKGFKELKISQTRTDNFFNLFFIPNRHLARQADIQLTTRYNGVRRKFSKGQSKRMSMIFALLENKPILVLDEWAADQDPHFRKYFYENLIPQLRKEGKTIIAVTHDDAYFKYADRIIKFDYGNIVKEINVNEDKLFTIL